MNLPILLHRVGPLLVLGALAACGGERDARETESTPETESLVGQTCSVSLDDQEYLVTADGRHLFVEPRFVGVAGDELLVAGHPTYAWTIERGAQPEEFQASEAPGDPFFGAFLGESRARTIPPVPGAGPIQWVHGAPLGEERWAFIVETVETMESEALEPAHRGLLYGVLGREGWEQIEELPEAPERELLVSVASPPVRDGDDLVWAALDVKGAGSAVAVYRRGPSGWGVPQLLDVSPNAVDVLSTRAGSAWLVVSGLDPATDLQRASLRVYRDMNPDSVAVVWTAGIDEHFQNLRAVETDDGLQVGWVFRGGPNQGAWVVPATPARRRVPKLLDADAMTLERLGTRDGWAFWATLAADPISGAGQLRLHRSSADTVEQIADLPSPYLGLSSGTLSPGGEIVVVGPEAHFETATPFVRSLVLRFSLTCDPSNAADHLPGR